MSGGFLEVDLEIRGTLSTQAVFEKESVNVCRWSIIYILIQQFNEFEDNPNFTPVTTQEQCQ